MKKLLALVLTVTLVATASAPAHANCWPVPPTPGGEPGPAVFVTPVVMTLVGGWWTSILDGGIFLDGQGNAIGVVVSWTDELLFVDLNGDRTPDDTYTYQC